MSPVCLTSASLESSCFCQEKQRLPRLLISFLSLKESPYNTKGDVALTIFHTLANTWSI